MVHTDGGTAPVARRPARTISEVRKRTSKEALCATRARPSRTSSRSSATSRKRGAPRTSEAVMPWTRVAPTSRPGLTSVSHSSSTEPSGCSATTPTSTIRSDLGLKPVVSRSKTAYPRMGTLPLRLCPSRFPRRPRPGTVHSGAVPGVNPGDGRVVGRTRTRGTRGGPHPAPPPPSPPPPRTRRAPSDPPRRGTPCCAGARRDRPSRPRR